jgi:hypothetical protein
VKVIIAGSRSINDFSIVEEAIRDSQFPITEVVSGGARGVDKLGEEWADKNMVPIKKFPAQWGKYGKSAGPIRNREMAEYADALISIWDGNSRGTMSMVREAKRAGLRTFCINNFWNNTRWTR